MIRNIHVNDSTAAGVRPCAETPGACVMKVATKFEVLPYISNAIREPTSKFLRVQSMIKYPIYCKLNYIRIIHGVKLAERIPVFETSTPKSRDLDTN